MKNLFFSIMISCFIPLFLSVVFVSCGGGLLGFVEKDNPKSAWDYKRIINISNPLDIDLIDHQVKIQFNSDLYTIVEDFVNNIRFYHNSTSLSYWIEEIDLVSESATIWVKIDRIEPGGIDIEILYGNSSVSSLSDFESTFTKDHYSSNANLVGLWHMDEGSGELIQDESDYLNDGTKTGSTEWITGIGGGWGDQSGTETVFSNEWALSFDEEEDHVVIPDDSTLDSPAITVETWIKTGADVDSDQFVISKWYEIGDNRSYALTVGEGSFHFYTSSTGTVSYVDILHCSTVQENTWYHFAAVASNSGKSILINGGAEQCDDSSATDDLNIDNEANLVFGRMNDHEHDYGLYPFPFMGVIDEVAIYNRALSVDEILAHAQRRKFVPGVEVISITEEMDN